MQEMTVKRWISSAIAIVIAVFLFVGQTFALVTVNGVGESGLQLLDFRLQFLPAEGYAWMGNLFGALNLVHLLAGIGLFAVNIIALFLFEDKLLKVMHTLTAGISVLFALYYTAEGIAYAAILSSIAGKTQMTYAFFAPLLVIFGVVGYVAIDSLLTRELPKIRALAEKKAREETLEEKLEEENEMPTSDMVPRDKLDAYLYSIRGYVRPNKMEKLKSVLSRLTAEQFASVSLTSLKNPSLVLLFSVFFGIFAIDRFYIGDFKYAILKLLFGWLTLWVWQIFDVFYCYRDAKEMNFRLLTENAARVRSEAEQK